MARPKQTSLTNSPYVVDPQTRIGHVHLKVADLERALDFYRGVLGFELVQRLGDSAVFLSAGGYHHHLGLNTWESLGGSPSPPGITGLYHTAIVYPSRPVLAAALRRVLAAGIPLESAADHGVSESIYLRDPDDNGVELYCDKPKPLWPRTPDGKLAMFTHPLDLRGLLSEPLPDLPLSSGPKELGVGATVRRRRRSRRGCWNIGPSIPHHRICRNTTASRPVSCEDHYENDRHGCCQASRPRSISDSDRSHRSPPHRVGEHHQRCGNHQPGPL